MFKTINNIHSAATKTMKRVLTRSVAAVVMAVTLMLAPLQGYAITFYNYGSPGSAQVPATQAWLSLSNAGGLSFPTRYVWRSPASSGTQWFKATYYIYKYNDSTRSWFLYKRDFTSTIIFAGQAGAWVSGLNFPVANSSKYATVVDIEWLNENFAWLGTKRFYYNGPDYECIQFGIQSCSAGYGFIALNYWV